MCQLLSENSEPVIYYTALFQFQCKNSILVFTFSLHSSLTTSDLYIFHQKYYQKDDQKPQFENGLNGLSIMIINCIHMSGVLSFISK